MSDSLLIDEFCDALWLEDGLARNTLDAYRRDLAQFVSWLEKQRGKNLPTADHGDLQAYLAHQFRKKIRASSAARLLSSLKRLFRWLQRQNRIAIDPTLNIDTPKLPRSLPKSLTEKDVASLLVAPDVETPRGERDKAIEVDCTHMGFAASPEGITAVSRALEAMRG